jgi:hypothetical protein
MTSSHRFSSSSFREVYHVSHRPSVPLSKTKHYSQSHPVRTRLPVSFRRIPLLEILSLYQTGIVSRTEGTVLLPSRSVNVVPHHVFNCQIRQVCIFRPTVLTNGAAFQDLFPEVLHITSQSAPTTSGLAAASKLLFCSQVSDCEKRSFFRPWTHGTILL